MCKLLLIALFVISFPFLAHGAEVTLAWDANTESDLAGYKIYAGLSSGIYTEINDVGNVTQYIKGDLIEGETYFFIATAYDNSGNESGYSQEVSYYVPIIVDTVPPLPPTNFREVQ